MTEALKIDRLTKQFGLKTAVDNVSFIANKGEVLGFLGPNGAGKSTTMKMVVGFLSPTSGTASVCGHDIIRNPLEVKRTVGYLPEGAPAYPVRRCELRCVDYWGYFSTIYLLGVQYSDASKLVVSVNYNTI